MPTWEVIYRMRIETIADRRTEAINLAEGELQTRFESDLVDVNLIDGDPPPALQEVLTVKGDRKFWLTYKDEDDDPEMPLFFRLEDTSDWWSNGHVALRLEKDPPAELQAPYWATTVPTMEKLRKMLDPPAPEGAPCRVADRYKRFLEIGDSEVRYGDDWVRVIEVFSDGEPIAIVSCVRPERL